MTWLEAHAFALATLAAFAYRYNRPVIAAGAAALALADAGSVLAPPWPYSALWASLGAPVSLGMVGELCGVLPRHRGTPLGIAFGGGAWGLIYTLGEWLGKPGFALAALAIYAAALIMGSAWWLWRLRALPLAPWHGALDALALIGTLTANCIGWVAYAYGGTMKGSILCDIIGCIALIGVMVKGGWDD